MAARVLSARSATSRAAPAVSAATRVVTPSLRRNLRHWPSAMMWLSTTLSRAEGRPLRRHELVADRQEPLADNVQPGRRHQIMNVGDPAGDRILDRNHGEIGFARRYRGEGVLEGRTGNGIVFRECFAAGDMRVGPRLALKGDGPALHAVSLRAAFGPSQCAAARMARAAASSSGVSTPKGTESTIATSMRMPASSARNCSSFSRRSSDEGGSATNRASASRR